MNWNVSGSLPVAWGAAAGWKLVSPQPSSPESSTTVHALGGSTHNGVSATGSSPISGTVIGSDVVARSELRWFLTSTRSEYSPGGRSRWPTYLTLVLSGGVPLISNARVLSAATAFLSSTA